jgi:hypothetical protein
MPSANRHSGTPPLFIYGLFAVAFVALGLTMFMSLAWAKSSPDGMERYAAYAVVAITGPGSLMCFTAAVWAHRQGGMGVTALSAAFWIALSAGEINTAGKWLEARARGSSAPFEQAKHAAQEAQKDLATERAALDSIRKKLLDERREAKIDELRKDKATAEKRVFELSTRSVEPVAGHVENWFSGNGAYAAALLMVVGHGFFAIALFCRDSHRGAPVQFDPRALRPEELEAVRRLLELGETTLTISPTPPKPAQLVAPGRTGYNHATSGRPTTPNHAQPAITSGAHAQPHNQLVDAQALGYEEKPLGRPDAQPAGYVVGPTSLGAQPDAQPTSLGEVGGSLGAQIRPVGAQPQPAAQPVPPKHGTALRLVETRPALTAFQITVRDMLDAGMTERPIATATGRKRHEVRSAKAAIAAHATKSSKEGT